MCSIRATETANRVHRFLGNLCRAAEEGNGLGVSPLQEPNIPEARRMFLKVAITFDFAVADPDTIQSGFGSGLSIVIPEFVNPEEALGLR
jgi:hypothetical protein